MNKIKHTPKRLFVVTLLLCGLMIIQTQAAPGDLDPSFGNGGIVISPFTPLSDQITSIQVQPDGKIIVSGYSYAYDGFEDFEYATSGFIARYNSSGTLDASFGSNGKIITGNYYEFVGGKTILQPDGKIVSIGERITVSGGFIVAADFTVFRYNDNGTLDASFGTGGKVFTPVGTATRSYARDVVLQPDGKIVVMGLILWDENPQRSKFGIVRYNPDGSFDNSFGGGGKVITDAGSSAHGYPSWMLLQPDGKIVLGGVFQKRNQAGYYIDYSILARYNPDGSLDSGFGTNGEVIRELPGYDAGLHSVLQPDGKIVVTGDRGDLYYGKEITRFNADGSVDTSFADNGSFKTESGLFGSSIALQPNGKIVAFGGSSFAALRLNPNGSPDTSFGTNGRLITPVGTRGASYGLAVALQADGKILGGGVTDASAGIGDAAIVRYAGDSITTRRTQFDFDGDGRADIAVIQQPYGIWSLNRSTLGVSSVQLGLCSDQITTADFDGDGKTDVGVFRDGVWYWINSSNGGYQNAHFGLAGDIAHPFDFTGDGRADLTVYRAGLWYTLDLVNNRFQSTQFGIRTDTPVPADYDGDGRVDHAVYRAGTWYLLQSARGFSTIQFGLPTDKPLPADYDGDGQADIAVYRPSDATWYLQRGQFGFTAIPFGLESDVPVPADYDGDGRTDIAVFRPANRFWYQSRSRDGFTAVQFGADGSNRPVRTEPLSSGLSDGAGCWDYRANP